jgi:hypothetical protein
LISLRTSKRDRFFGLSLVTLAFIPGKTLASQSANLNEPNFIFYSQLEL